MSLVNVFRMEVFKNWHDRTSLFIMLAFAVVNSLAGFMMVTLDWHNMPIVLFTFSIIGSIVFLFIYPYRMARNDYKNKVMSLLIASGVSRVQYYFVKVGATLLFSFLSVFLIAMVPIVIAMLASEGFSFAIDFLYGALEIDATALLMFFSAWLATFSILMTSVIIARGRGFSIFIFLGINFVSSLIPQFFHNLTWSGENITAIIFFQILTIVVVSLIGIFVLRTQDL